MSDRIVSDINIFGGEPRIKGTRIPARIILIHLAAGDRVEELLRDFPSITEEDIRAYLEYASYLATEHVA